MKYSFDQIDALAELLADQIAGNPVDLEAVRNLAKELSVLCPDISGTMSRIVEWTASSGLGGGNALPPSGP